MPTKKDNSHHNANDPEELLRNESSEKKNDLKNDTENSSKNENSESNVESKELLDKIIHNANQYFLLEILSPQIKENEVKKRIHKDKLISIVKLFLIIQFSVLSVLILGIIGATLIFHYFNNDIELSFFESITKFISLYITSVVAELIAMLYFIVSNVFDTSITGLVELYKDATANISDITKEQEN